MPPDNRLHHKRFQSTLPRGERLPVVLLPLSQAKISIHAPARGATFSHFHASLFFNISIHAPARGATLFIHNPVDLLDISIHAPARGATDSLFCYFTFYSDFNPRSREGSDDFFRPAAYNQINFNPRSREGSD